MPTRSPASDSSVASASARTTARSAFEVCDRRERKCIDGDKSIQIQTVWAASHSRSRTKRWLDPAERLQSISEDELPASKFRYCQKVSPGPARRLPCVPWATVTATRRASKSSAGSFPTKSWEAPSRARADGRERRSDDIKRTATSK